MASAASSAPFRFLLGPISSGLLLTTAVLPAGPGPSLPERPVPRGDHGSANLPAGLSAALGRLRHRLVHAFITPWRGELRTRLRGDQLEDATLYAGFYLAALSEAWAVSPDAETAGLCRQLLAGLSLNASAAAPGYIARGVEADLDHWRGDPSVDQYTGWFYGLFAYQKYGPALPLEKQRIGRLAQAVLERLRRDHWQIMRANGKAITTFGRLAALQPTRAERLLAFLAAGARLTGDPAWEKEYRGLWPTRGRCLTGYDRFDSWVLLQSAAALDLLRAWEKRPNPRAVIAGACREVAAACMRQVGAWREFAADPRAPQRKLRDAPFLLRTVRIPIEAVTSVLLVGDRSQAEKVLPLLENMIRTFPVEACDYAPPLVSLAWAWRRSALRRLTPPVAADGY